MCSQRVDAGRNLVLRCLLSCAGPCALNLTSSSLVHDLQDLRRAEVLEAQVKELQDKLEQVQKVAAQLTSQVDR